MTIDNMKGVVEELKGNFLFQASLGSKELFHSNMIAWFLEQESSEGELRALDLFLNRFVGIGLPEMNSSKHIFEIQREHLNIDLIINWQDGKEWKMVFIENKMKSIPTKEQLKEYDDKIKKLDGAKRKLNNDEVVGKVERQFLLTPFPVESEILESKWRSITYHEDMIPFLQSMHEIEFKNSSIRNVIAEYIKLLDGQRGILDYFHLGDDEQVFLAQPYNFYSGTETVTQVRNLRLHDLVLKQVHDRIANVLKKRVDERGIHVVRCVSEFSNSTGITTIEIGFVENKFKMGLQLQGDQLRYYTLAEPSMNVKTAITLFLRKIWFCDIDTKGALLGKGRRHKDFEHMGMIDESGNSRAFCEYSKGHFLYLYKKCNWRGELLTIGEIVDLIVRSLEHIKNAEQEIVDIYNSVD